MPGSFPDPPTFKGNALGTRLKDYKCDIEWQTFKLKFGKFKINQLIIRRIHCGAPGVSLFNPANNQFVLEKL